jgi:pimeloyl-ACP methyl ester carboxylesterase
VRGYTPGPSMEAQGQTRVGSVRPDPEVSGGSQATRSAADHSETVRFDDAGRLIFDARPLGSAQATIVVASSLFAEFQRNYRREVLLARRAAAAGLRTIRFHYRGTGNSIARQGPPDLHAMVNDLTEIVTSTDGPVALVGTRVGAIAAAMARGAQDIPLVLWEPVIDGDRWIEEVIRAALARELGEGSTVDADTIRRRWTDDGVAFVLGETVPSTIIDSIRGIEIADHIFGTAPVQVIQMARNDKVKRDVARLADALHARGIDTEVQTIVGKQTWWVNEGGDLFRPMERDEPTDRLIDGVIDFVRRSAT